MEIVILIFLILLLALGLIQIPFFVIQDVTLFTWLGRTISLYDLLVFVLILWIIEFLPWPFRGLASVILLLWLLGFFGIITIGGFSNILLLALIIGMIAYIVRGLNLK